MISIPLNTNYNALNARFKFSMLSSSVHCGNGKHLHTKLGKSSQSMQRYCKKFITLLLLVIINYELSLLLWPGRGAEYYNHPICVSVCLSASISLEPLDRSSRNFVCTSPVAMAQSSSGGIFTTLCTSGLMDDITFGHNGPYGVAWPAWAASWTSLQLHARPLCSLMLMNAMLGRLT